MEILAKEKKDLVKSKPLIRKALSHSLPFTNGVKAARVFTPEAKGSRINPSNDIERARDSF